MGFCQRLSFWAEQVWNAIDLAVTMHGSILARMNVRYMRRSFLSIKLRSFMIRGPQWAPNWLAKKQFMGTTGNMLNPLLSMLKHQWAPVCVAKLRVWTKSDPKFAGLWRQSLNPMHVQCSSTRTAPGQVFLRSISSPPPAPGCKRSEEPRSETSGNRVGLWSAMSSTLNNTNQYLY